MHISSHLLFVYINNQNRKWCMSVLVFSSALTTRDHAECKSKWNFRVFSNLYHRVALIVGSVFTLTFDFVKRDIFFFLKWKRKIEYRTSFLFLWRTWRSEDFMPHKRKCRSSHRCWGKLCVKKSIDNIDNMTIIFYIEERELTLLQLKK